MNILVLSFYFQPDLCAGSFRTTSLVKEFESILPAGSHIDIVTTLPNRYSTFSADAPELESRSGLEIRRIALPPHQSGMVDQSKAFLSFSRQASKHVAYREYDLVFATSSRLMTAVLGAWIAGKKQAPLYLDIRDIFVDTIKDVLPSHLALVAKPVFSLLERWAVKRAVRINLVSKGFAGYFSFRYPKKEFSYFTNGIDDEFITAALDAPTEASANSPLTVLYAGNIGEGQGLHAILPALAKKMEGRLHFKVIGDGGRKEALAQALAEEGVTNVELLPPIKRDSLIEAYKAADVLFLHLNDYDAFKKVLPSKLFEYAAIGKPIWAGIAGYSAEFVRSEILNSAVFPPCDAEQAMQVFENLVLSVTPRADFVEKYARQNIAKGMAKEIVNSAERGH